MTETATSPWPLATDRARRIIAWPRWERARGLASVLRLAQEAGAFDHGDVCLCLRLDPAIDPPTEKAMEALSAAIGEVLPADGDAQLLLVNEAISEIDWPRLGAAVVAAVGSSKERDPSRLRFLRALDRPVLTRSSGLKSFLDDDQLLTRAEASEETHPEIRDRAPEHPGFATTERFIEEPWCLARLRGTRVVLDVGNAHAGKSYLQKLASLHIPDLYGIDLSPIAPMLMTDHTGRQRPLLTAVQGDIRQTDFPSDFFDAITCISTIEHVGMDNRHYGVKDAPSTDRCDRAAIVEMCRITKPRGRLLLTVPFGTFQNHGWFVQYDMTYLVQLISTSGYDVSEMHFFKYRNGWSECFAYELKSTGYATNGALAAAGLACIELQKPLRS